MIRKKILHITQALGGVKTYLEHVFEYADFDKFEFAIIAPADVAFEKLCADKGIKYYAINLQRSISPVQDTIGLIKMISIIKKEKPGVIHTHSAKGGFLGRLAAKFTGNKVIYTPHGFSYMSFTGVKRVLFYSLEMLAGKWTSMVMAVSYSEANRAIFEVGIRPEKVKVILNAIPVPDLKVREEKPCVKIGMIGRLTYQKNPLLFLEVAYTMLQKNPNLEFSILGAGLHDHLTTEINEFLEAHQMKDKIQLLQWGNQGTSKRFLEETDVFVMTSVFEGLPYSLVEAMSMGIPCVVSKVDGNTDVIHNNENGFACFCVEEFCEKIENLISNDVLRVNIGEAGYNYINRFHNIHKNISSLENLYFSVMDYRYKSTSIPALLQAS